MSEGPPGPIVIIAGSGQLPSQVAATLASRGDDHRVLAFRGFTDGPLRRRADAVIDLLDVKRALACLDGWRPRAVTLAGGMTRPGPSAALGAVSFLRNAREVGALLQRGDDQLLRGVVSFLEERGHRVVGAHELAPQLLAADGPQSRAVPTEADALSIALGRRLLRDLSPYDIGQAVVVAGERALAVEGPEGTDRMLGRVAGLRRGFPFRRRERGGVLVKIAKRGQDLRVDMPAIGPRTIREAARAGLAGVAVGSGSTLVLERERTTALADGLGLFLVGVPAEIAS